MADEIQSSGTAFETSPNTQAAYDKLLSNPAAPTSEPDRQPASQEVHPEGPINVINPEGSLVSIPGHQLQDALGSGYQLASDEHVQKYAREQKYGSLGQEAITALEGAGEGASFGLSTGLESALGVSPEDISGRRETNPGAHALGQIAGVAGSALIPVLGEANILKAAGEGAVAAVGLGAAESAIAKIGSGAVKLAVENTLFQAGDEVSKMLAKDPAQTVETAAANIGLSGIIGGVLGGGVSAINPLWKATVGNKVGGVLKTLVDKAGGIDGTVPDAINDAIEVAGVNLAPEIRSALSNDPHIRQAFQTLQESSTRAGVKAQEALKQAKGQLSEAILTSLGKDPKQLHSIEAMSTYDAGDKLKSALVKELKTQIDPISEQFNKVRERFKDLELPTDQRIPDEVQKVYPEGQYEGLDVPVSSPSRPGVATEITDALMNKAQQEGWINSPSSPEMALINRTIKELPLQKTLNDLRNFQSIIADEAQRQQLWQVGKTIRTVMREAEENLVTQKLGEEAPEVLASHAAARSAYKDAMSTIEDLNERLHVGRYGGPESFINALKEMPPEDVLRRLSPKNDAGIIKNLAPKFPGAAGVIKDFHLDQALKTAADKAGEGEALNAKAFYTALDKLSPEMRGFILPEASGAKIDAIQHLIEGLPAKMNNSGTAKTLDSLWKHTPGGALGILSVLTGHGVGEAFGVSQLTNILTREVPDATRLALLKFLGTNKPIQSESFKAMADMIASTIKGQNLVARATKNVFRAGEHVLPESQMPTQKDRDKLDKQLNAIRNNPNGLMQAADSKIGHYMPGEAEHMGQTTANAVNFLNNIRPNVDKAGILDRKPTASAQQKSAYNNALDIAQQPLVVLNKIQKGMITQQDVVALKTIYPNLYNKLNDSLMEQINTTVSKGQTIPYKTRLGLSLFMGQPLDSTITPQAILAAQPKQQSSPQPAPQQTSKLHSTKEISKASTQFRSPGQAREMEKSQGK